DVPGADGSARCPREGPGRRPPALPGYRRRGDRRRPPLPGARRDPPRLRSGASRREGRAHVPRALRARRPPQGPAFTIIDQLSHAEACALIETPAAGLDDLLARAGEIRDRGRGRTVTFSKKVFVPLTTLCRDYCGYCTFRRDPGEPGAHTMTPDEVVALVQARQRLGATQALFSLGDKPEVRFAVHREFLRRHAHRTTLQYLRAICDLTLTESSLLPHV